MSRIEVYDRLLRGEATSAEYVAAARAEREEDARRAPVTLTTDQLADLAFKLGQAEREVERLRGVISQVAHDIGEEGYSKWSREVYDSLCRCGAKCWRTGGEAACSIVGDAP